MSQLAVLPFFRAADSNNDPLPGAKLYFYDTTTLSLRSVYTTSALSVAHANPVVANSAGLFAPIYLDPDYTYRAILKTSAGVEVIDVDPITAGDGGLLGDLAADTGATLVGSGTGRTVEEALDSLPTPFLPSVPAAPTYLKVFGDSFSLEPNTHTSSGHGIGYQINSQLGLTLENESTSGISQVESQTAIFAYAPATTRCIAYMLGQNDANHYGSIAENLFNARTADCAGIALANLAWLAKVAGSDKVRGSSLTTSGTWAADASFAEGGAIKSTTNGSVAQAILTDADAVVVIHRANGYTGALSGGRFRVSINDKQYDGPDGQGFRTNPFSDFAHDSSTNTYRSALVFKLPRRLKRVKVQIEVLSATNAANDVGVHTIMGFNGTAAGPVLGVGDLSDREATGWASAAGSQTALPVVSRAISRAAAIIGTLGGRVVLLPIAANIDPTTDLDSDELHPAEAGKVAAGNAAAVVLAAALTGQTLATSNYDRFVTGLLEDADGYPLAIGVPQFLGTDMRGKRARLDGRALYFASPFNYVLHSASVRFVFDDGTGTFDTGKAAYVQSDASGFAYFGSSYATGECVLGAFGDNRLRLTATTFSPDVDGAIALGTSSKKYTSIDLGTAGVKVSGTKVVGAQGTAVADASGGATVDAEARTALNALLARVRTHGLIAT